jgi:hypothetical protein
MRGDTVVVRGFRGRPYVRRVWEVGSEAVYVCSEERYQRLIDDTDEWPPIGFPREDVFFYDVGLVGVLMEQWNKDQTIWNNLRAWG